MKKLFFILPILAMLLITSCSSMDKTNQQTVNEVLINRIQSSNSSDVTAKECSYSYTLNFDNNKADVTIYGLQLSPSSQKYDKIEIRDMSWTLSSTKGYNFTIGSTTSVLVNGEKSSTVSIQSFETTILNYATSYAINTKYTIATPDGTFLVDATRTGIVYTKVSTTVINSGNSFSWNDAMMGVKLSTESKKSFIILDNIKFDSKIPSVLSGMRFDGLELVPTATGYTLTSESLIPTLAEVPFPQYKITDLKCVVQGGAAELTFKMGVYNVTMSAILYEPKAAN